MNVNLTLLVQAGNFFLAYILLEKILFRPVITVIQKEEQDLAALTATINTQQKLVAEMEQLKKQKWVNARVYFQEKLPPLHSMHTVTPLNIPAIEASEAEIAAERIFLEHKLLARIEHV